LKQPPTQRAQEEFAEVYRDPDLAGELLSYTFSVHGKRLDMASIQYLSEEPPAPGITLEATVPYGVYTPPPEGAQVFVDVGLQGSAKIRTFTGTLQKPIRDGENMTLIGVSPGYYHETALYHRLFGEVASFSGRAPSDVAHELIARMRLYNGIAIPRVPGPLFQEEGEDAFDYEATIGQILESLRDSSDLWVYDDGWGFCRGMLLSQMEQPGEPVVNWRVGRHILPTSFTYAVRDEERYRDIALYRMVLDEPELVVGNPDRHESQFIEIPYQSALAIPPIGITLPVLTEDPDDAAVIGMGMNMAAAMAMGTHTWEFMTPFIDPRIERGDTVAWRETVFEGEERVERYWRGVVGYMNHMPKAGSALYGGVGGIFSTESASANPDPLPTGRRSAGVIGVG
jgi:hypothetical protein